MNDQQGCINQALWFASEMVGVLKDLCIEMNVELSCYSALKLKICNRER